MSMRPASLLIETATGVPLNSHVCGCPSVRGWREVFSSESMAIALTSAASVVDSACAYSPNLWVKMASVRAMNAAAPASPDSKSSTQSTEISAIPRSQLWRLFEYIFERLEFIPQVVHYVLKLIVVAHHARGNEQDQFGANGLIVGIAE